MYRISGRSRGKKGTLYSMWKYMFQSHAWVEASSGDVSAAMTLDEPLQGCIRACLHHPNKISRVQPSRLLDTSISTIAIYVQHEGHHSCASYPGYGISSLVAQIFNISRNRCCNIDSCCARRASLEPAFRLAYCILPGRHKSHEGMETHLQATEHLLMCNR